MAENKHSKECFISLDLPEKPSSDSSLVCAASRRYCASSRNQQCESGRHGVKSIKRAQARPRKVPARTVMFKSFDSAHSASTGATGRGMRVCVIRGRKCLPAPNSSGNNSTGAPGSTRCASHRCSGGCGTHARTFGNVGTSAAGLMKCCVQNTMEQVKQMHVKSADCSRGNPYAALRTETFKRLLKRSRRRGKRGNSSNKKTKKITWCKPKYDECDDINLQLCPHLGEGHTHEKLIEEVTAVLLRATQSVNCQLREICRRLFFMKHNVPQMTAPALVNFHAILAEITRMLIADFSSFPSGLRMPDNRATK